MSFCQPTPPAPLSTIAVIAKEPVPGRVKTRLIGAEVTAEHAARLAECALSDTLAAASKVPARRRVVVLDGRPGPWLPAGWGVLAQSSGLLDERLAVGFAGFGSGPALLVGMDTPQLAVSDMDFDWGHFDACLGMAADGGYWAIGFSDPRPAPAVITGVPMSTSSTGAIQLARLRDAGLRVQLLRTLTDVDDHPSAEQVATASPDTAFARCWREITARVAAPCAAGQRR